MSVGGTKLNFNTCSDYQAVNLVVLSRPKGLGFRTSESWTLDVHVPYEGLCIYSAVTVFAAFFGFELISFINLVNPF